MEVELSTPTQCSSEEEDELHRSVKKFKESNGASSFLQPRKLVSYKDSLVGDIPGAYEQAFSCGRLGHKKESCYYQVKQVTTEKEVQSAPRTNETREEIQFDVNYGSWLVVTRKKLVSRMGRSNGQTKSNQTSQFKAKGNLDLSQEHYLEETGKDLDKSHHSDSADSSSEATHTTTTQIQQKDLEMVNDCMVKDWKEASGSGSQQEESGGDSKRGYSTNSNGTDRDSGLVQGRAGASMKATIPHNSNKH
nr:hypothetical protein CFP56_43411 [Quercus suber]